MTRARRIAFVAATFATLLVRAASAQTAAPCESGDIARIVALPNDTAHVFASAALDDGRVFVAGIESTAHRASPLAVRIAIVPRCDAATPSWSGTAEVGRERRTAQTLAASDGLSLRIVREGALAGPASWLRVGVVSQAGEDFAFVTELVLLYRIAGGEVPTLAWSGIGSTNENQNERCVIDHVLSFHGAGARTIVGVDRVSSSPRTRGCRGRPRAPIRFTVR